MNGTPDISVSGLLFCLLLLVLPGLLERRLRPGIFRPTLIASLRMVLQLGLVGVFLKYVFDLDRPWLTILWLAVMVMFAAGTVVRSSRLQVRHFYLPVLASLTATLLFVLVYFNGAVVQLSDLLEAKYAIAIGGMLLGNSLKGCIIGISNFYGRIRSEEAVYRYHLALGASRFEALAPFIREAFSAALMPTVATMSTLGIVFLPGMMTGQIIGGSGPVLAIKYQIAIMLAIYACIILAVTLSLWLTVKSSFDEFGMLRKERFTAAA
jgi:putative ABC transport system permease protein